MAERSSTQQQETTSLLEAENVLLRKRIEDLEARVEASVQSRRALLHIMGDLAESNRRLNDQRRAMVHILVDYESDRKDLANQTEKLNNSRRALMHIVGDAHESNKRLSESRKAMIHIMGDLRDMTEEISQRERELRDKQDQLVQAAKLATLGELTTGIAHELNNPLNNIGLYLGNVLDRLDIGQADEGKLRRDLSASLTQVHKATEIISHLRTFGRSAPSLREPVAINDVIHRACSLLQEQFRLRGIDLTLDLDGSEPVALGNPIQLEQVVMNLLTNARDAVSMSPERRVVVRTMLDEVRLRVAVFDTGPGVPPELEQKVFDPFFTTKEVGEGTGLGLSIVYGIIKEHGGNIFIEPGDSGGKFIIELPAMRVEPE
jgi:C4-dicarboxylate-specific signal transduction histidine kinase